MSEVTLELLHTRLLRIVAEQQQQRAEMAAIMPILQRIDEKLSGLIPMIILAGARRIPRPAHGIIANRISTNSDDSAG